MVKGWKKGDEVECFYRFEHDGSGDGGESYFPILSPDAGLLNPRLGRTDSWQKGKVLGDWDPARYNPKDRSTWITVQMMHNRWSNRKGIALDLSDPHNTTVSFPPSDVRTLQQGLTYQPRVSFFVVRWGGPYPVPDHAEDGEFGGWGDIGTNICDRYINRFFSVVYDKLGPDYEVYSCFVSQSADLPKLYGPGIAGLLKGKYKAAMYYLWPVAWIDCNEGATGYVEKNSLFQAMQAMECAGIPTRHPHPSNLYNMFASKAWTSQLCLAKDFCVPVTTKVNRALILDDPTKAARGAAKAVLALQAAKYGMTHFNESNLRGVAKLGFSWEAQDVYAFTGIDELGKRLEALLEQQGCVADCVYVQEEIPNNCEVRVYLINGKPQKYLYSRFQEVNPDKGSFSNFRRIDNRDLVLKEWLNGNDAGLRDAEEKITVLTDRWLTWMRAENPEIPPVCRMDFFIHLKGAHATVYTGELTEQGASMLGWAEGPRLTFEAVLNECLEQTLYDGTNGPPAGGIPNFNGAASNGSQAQGGKGRKH